MEGQIKFRGQTADPGGNRKIERNKKEIFSLDPNLQTLFASSHLFPYVLIGLAMVVRRQHPNPPVKRCEINSYDHNRGTGEDLRTYTSALRTAQRITLRQSFWVGLS